MAISLGVMDFAFMGGSMGSVVGEKIARLTRHAIDKKTPLILVSASGGARMQEGVLSLMQMAKTSVVIAELHGRASLHVRPHEPDDRRRFRPPMRCRATSLSPSRARSSVRGPRVIKQTIGQDLPEGFQTAEFLLDHGMIDAVVPRGDCETRRAVAAAHDRRLAG